MLDPIISRAVSTLRETAVTLPAAVTTALAKLAAAESALGTARTGAANAEATAEAGAADGTLTDAQVTAATTATAKAAMLSRGVEAAARSVYAVGQANAAAIVASAKTELFDDAITSLESLLDTVVDPTVSAGEFAARGRSDLADLLDAGEADLAKVTAARAVRDAVSPKGSDWTTPAAALDAEQLPLPAINRFLVAVANGADPRLSV